MTLSMPASIENNLHRVPQMVIYGKPAKDYTKEELIAFIAWMTEERKKMMDEHSRQMSKLISLQKIGGIHGKS